MYIVSVHDKMLIAVRNTQSNNHQITVSKIILQGATKLFNSSYILEKKYLVTMYEIMEQLKWLGVWSVDVEIYYDFIVAFLLSNRVFFC